MEKACRKLLIFLTKTRTTELEKNMGIYNQAEGNTSHSCAEVKIGNWISPKAPRTRDSMTE